MPRPTRAQLDRLRTDYERYLARGETDYAAGMKAAAICLGIDVLDWS